MNKETVTLKKKPPMVKLTGSVIFIVFLCYLSHVNTTLYFVSLAVSLFTVMYAMDFLTYTLAYFRDTEKYVVVSQKSMQNLRAQGILRETEKIKEKYNICAAIVFAVIATAAVGYVAFKVESNDSGTFLMVFAYILGIALYYGVISHGNKIIGKKYMAVVSECDPQLMYDIMEQKRTELLTPYEKTIVFFIQVLATYYLDDYDTMFARNAKLEEDIKDTALQAYSIGFLGSAYINAEDEQGYEYAWDLLNALEDDGLKDDKLKKICNYIRNRWKVQIGARDGEADQVLDMAVDSAYEIRGYAPMKMEMTYLLAELQEMKGFTDRAMANYRDVADHAGKMKIRQLAVDKLKEA